MALGCLRVLPRISLGPCETLAADWQDVANEGSWLKSPLLLQVKYVMARDVRLEDVGGMIEKLGNWASTTKVLLTTLEVRCEIVTE